MSAATVVRWVADGAIRSGGLADIGAARAAGPLWIDVSEPDRETLTTLAEAFGLHPLAIEDVLHDDQRSKTEPYEDHLFFVWLVPDRSSADTLHGVELDAFLGKGWLITAHRGGVRAIDEVGADAACVLARGPEWTLHAILDRAVDEVFPVVDAAGDRLDEIGDTLLERVDRSALPELHAIKRRLLQLHKIIGPERDALREMAREQAYVSEEAYRYFQDIQDHLARIEDRVDTYRDVAASVMDIYLSAVSNRLNVVMKRLTVVATIFMPGTFIVGLYGMNFRYMPELGWRLGYLWAWAAIIIVTGSMLWWFKRSEWW